MVNDEQLLRYMSGKGEKYLLGEEIVNSSFMKSLCEIIFTSKKRIGRSVNLSGVIRNLIKLRASYFLTIFVGVLEHFGRTLSESIQSVQLLTELFKQTTLSKIVPPPQTSGGKTVSLVSFLGGGSSGSNNNPQSSSSSSSEELAAIL